MSIIRACLEQNLVLLENEVKNALKTKLNSITQDFENVYVKNRPESEKRFVRKHKIELQQDRNGNAEDVFRSSKVKSREEYETRKDQHGWLPGEDEEVYEEADSIEEILESMALSAINKIKNTRLKNKYAEDAETNRNRLKTATTQSAKDRMGKV
jgi:hypothetical protein